MKEAHKKRPPRATANSPPALLDMGGIINLQIKIRDSSLNPIFPIYTKFIAPNYQRFNKYRHYIVILF